MGGPPKMSYQLVCGGTLLILLPVSTTVLTGNKKGGWSPKNELPVSTIVLTGKKKGGWSPQKVLPVSMWWYPLDLVTS